MKVAHLHIDKRRRQARRLEVNEQAMMKNETRKKNSNWRLHKGERVKLLMLFSKEENKNLHQIKSEEKRKIRNEIFEGKFTYGL